MVSGVGEETRRKGSQSRETDVLGAGGGACSPHGVTWAGSEEGRAGPCSLPSWPPPLGLPSSMPCSVLWCSLLWAQVLNTKQVSGVQVLAPEP